MVLTATAPAITKASDGSQAPPTSRKPRILAGLAMPETMRPSPKTRPASKEAMAVHMAGLPVHDRFSRWRITNTVATPAAMKATVAASERGERRASPHTPWPLVQPAP